MKNKKLLRCIVNGRNGTMQDFVEMETNIPPDQFATRVMYWNYHNTSITDMEIYEVTPDRVGRLIERYSIRG